MEIWKDILDYEGFYQVSNKGRVRSLDRTIINKRGSEMFFKGQIIIPRLKKSGYLDLNLRKKGTKKNFNVHKLVAEAFIGPRPKGLVINHIDENKINNDVSNLEFVTSEYNNNWGTKNERASKTRTDVYGNPVIGKHLNNEVYIYLPTASAGERITKKYFDRGATSRVARGEQDNHKGWKFIYVDESMLSDSGEDFSKYIVKSMSDFTSDEEFTKYIVSNGYKNGNKKSIYGINILTGERLDYESLTDASLDTNYDFRHSNISNVLAGRKNKHKGFKWFYKEN